MDNRRSISVAIWACFLFSLVWATPNYLSDYDRARLQKVAQSSFPPKDLPTAHHSVFASKYLGTNIPKVEDVCKFLADNGVQTSLESSYYVVSTWKAIGSCPGSIPIPAITKAFTEALTKDSSISDLYFAALGLKSLGKPLAKDVVSAVVKSVKAILKKDDSILNIAHALHIAAALGPEGAFAFDRIEDALVQADEVDGKYLQFEGGLSITALLVSGTFELAESLNKSPPITPQQTVKFANYFVSRRTVQTPKGVHNLANVIATLSKNKFQTHVSLSVVGSNAVSVDNPTLSIKACDLLGRPISEPNKLKLDATLRAPDGQTLLPNVVFTQTSDKMIYSSKLVKPSGETPGIYKLTLKVTPGTPDAKIITNVETPLNVKILAQAEFKEPLLIGTADSDQMTQPKFNKVPYPTKLNQILEIDSLQKLALRFSLKEKVTGKSLFVHQAFVRLSHQKTGQEVIFVADRDSTNGYKLDLDVGAKANELGHLSGAYKVELILGDAILSNSFYWHVADVKLNLGHYEPEQKQSLYKPKPEIKHLFRQPERRPPVFVSNLFTGLVFVPLLILFILWIKLGVNISNFSFALSTFVFHLSLAGIFCLFGLFWLQLNMFETLKYLMAMGLVTFLSGNKLLSNVASQRKR